MTTVSNLSSINQHTIPVLRTHQGSTDKENLRMLSWNETSHSTLFWATKGSKASSQNLHLHSPQEWVANLVIQHCKCGCRAENSFTHRHLCEFTGLDFEMAINEHYDEVMDVIDKLFVYIFNGLNSKYGMYFAFLPAARQKIALLLLKRLPCCSVCSGPPCPFTSTERQEKKC